MPVPQRAAAWWSVVLIALAYLLINFVLTKNTLAPIHQDDYLALGYGFEDMHWNISRPVSTNFIYFLGAMGAPFAFLVLSVLTVAMAALALRFQTRVFGREFAIPSVLLFAAIAFAHMASYEHGKLLGLATTLCSQVSGLLAICLLWDAWMRRSAGRAIAGIAMYLVAVFAKEDFILPPLMLFAWFWVMRLRETRPLRAAFTPFELTLTMALGVSAVGSIAYNFLLSSNPFVSGLSGDAAQQNASYAVGLAPTILTASFWKLTFGYAPFASALALVAFVVGAIFLPAVRWTLALIAALVFVLILPYALIPNNMPEFRVYGWLPWFGGVVAAVLTGLIERFGAKRGRKMVAWTEGALALGLALAVFGQANSYRQSVAGWYGIQEGINEHLLSSLRSHRSEIARETVVGIVGLDGLSPWSNTDAQYLHRKLYFDNRWVVFVPGDSIFFKRDPIVAGEPQTTKEFVTVEDVARACLPGRDLLLLQFDANGDAKVTRTPQWCATR